MKRSSKYARLDVRRQRRCMVREESGRVLMRRDFRSLDVSAEGSLILGIHAALDSRCHRTPQVELRADQVMRAKRASESRSLVPTNVGQHGARSPTLGAWSALKPIR